MGRLIDVVAYFAVCGITLLALRGTIARFRDEANRPVAREISEPWKRRSS